MTEDKSPQRWNMLTILLAATTVGAMAKLAVATVSPFIFADLGISKGQFGVLAGAMSFGAVALTVTFGILIDRYGGRPIILAGPLVLGACFVLFLLPQSFFIMLALLLVAGLAFGCITPLGNSGIVDWFPQSERGFALGLKQTGVPLGVSLTAVTLPPLATVFGWRAALASLGGVVILFGLVGYALYRDRNLGRQGQSAPPVPASPTAPTVAQAIRTFLRNPSMPWMWFMGFAFSVFQSITLNFLVPYLQEVFAMSPVKAGVYLGLSQLAGMLSRPLAGALSDRVFQGRRRETLYGSAFLGAGIMIALDLTPASTPHWLVGVLVFFVGGISMGWIGPYYALAFEQVERRFAGSASGMAVTMSMVGSLTGPPLFGYLVDVSSYHTALLTGAGIITLAGVLFTLLVREQVPGRAVVARPVQEPH